MHEKRFYVSRDAEGILRDSPVLQFFPMHHVYLIMDALGREKFLKSGAGWRFLKKQLKHYLETKEEAVASS